ncbi:zinc-dependent alcohol dehydrogenase [Streptomyces marispadix]|uniref:2-deoxy-scyllo-inosamine dehydrogenase n=1 Tax=Streptomyces marispadix TaxID=2922868 RepID=A0ABS9T478_9ACTN|nr:alcohol dehydrogenase catalytic domain-containing protein [Streptomyces marispadix]MCH6163331.1 alcohol dehydrogenase catalytic domain-containing protein [Streptomyces marispadix]
MKAAALVAPGCVETIDVPCPEYGASDVLLRMTGVGLCGTDVALVGGARLAPGLPWILGHEGAGEIVAVGSAAGGRRVGERVAVEPNYCCRRCSACTRGFTSGCTDRVAVGLATPGVLAEYVAVPAAFVHAAADHVSTADLVCAEPLTVARTAIRRAKISKGDKCLVVGAGSQGLLVCACLAAAGITPYVQEPHEGRRALAASLGAVPLERSASDVDQVFETSGAPAALRAALRHVVPGGRITFIGMSSASLELSPHELVSRQLTLTGSLIYDHPHDFTGTIAALEDGAINPHRVLKAEFSLEDAGAAFAAVASTPGKCWINFGSSAN